MTSGSMKSSRNERWFGARIAAPSPGTFSRPVTFGRYHRRRIGPRSTYFMSHQNTHIDYRANQAKGNRRMLAFGVLEWTFLTLLVLLVGAAGVFALFLVLQLFRNPTSRPRA